MLNKIQEEHIFWQLKNFGVLPLEDSLLGIVEEVGELSHAVTKAKQAVRLGEDHDAMAKDAIGDIVIFLISFCSNKGWNFKDVIHETWEQVKQRDWKKYPNNGRTE